MQQITVRNFAGGFLGGVLGILSSHYIDPSLIPFAVLIGVIIGWYNRDLPEFFRMARESTSLPFPIQLPEFIQEPLEELRGRIRILHKTVTSHPMGFVDTVTPHILIALLLMLCFGLIGFLLLFPERKVPMQVVVPTLVFEAAALLSIARSNLMDSKPKGSLAEMRCWYQRWEIVSRYGTLGYYCYTLLRIVWFTILGCIAIPIIIGPFACMFAGLSVLWLVGRTVQIGTKALCTINQQGAHLLCLCVTLATTVTAWVLYHTLFADPSICALIALGTGVASGVLTVILRPLVYIVYVWAETVFYQKDYLATLRMIAKSWFDTSFVRTFEPIYAEVIIARTE